MTQIYDSKKVEDLIRQYKAGDESVLGEILEESRALVETIVSRYDRTHREDMIQECLIKISKALKHFNPDIGAAHSYFTSVITNRCNDYVYRLNREREIQQELEFDPTFNNGSKNHNPLQRDQLLTDLKERNRRRFPTLPAGDIDEATEHIFYCILEGVHGKSRGAIKEMYECYGMNRHEATIIYHSSLAYLRNKYRMEAIRSNGENGHDLIQENEISLLPDLKEVVGEAAYERLSLVFSGMYIKIP